MKLFIHLKIVESQFHYPEKWPIEATCIDADNFSEGLWMDTLKKAIKSATQVFVFMELNPKYEAGKLTQILFHLIKNKTSVLVCVSGTHQSLDKPLQLLKAEQVEGKEQVVLLAENFFNAQS